MLLIFIPAIPYFVLNFFTLFIQCLPCHANRIYFPAASRFSPVSNVSNVSNVSISPMVTPQSRGATILVAVVNRNQIAALYSPSLRSQRSVDIKPRWSGVACTEIPLQ